MPSYYATRSVPARSRQYEAGDPVTLSTLTEDERARYTASGAIVPARFVDTAANLAKQNPVVGAGLVAYATDSGDVRVGDGTTAYNSLAAQGGTSVSAAKYSRRLMPDPGTVDVVMASPPTVSALATATAITNSALWPSTTYAVTSVANKGIFSYRGGAIAPMSQSTYPDRNYIINTAITDPVNANKAPYQVDFWFDGTTLEILAKGTGGLIRIRVNGQLVSASATTFTNNGSTYYLPLTFAARGPKRITIDCSVSLAFGGVATGPTDSVWAAQATGPRCIVLGDSFTDGTGATASAASNWVRRFAGMMGWDDTWSSGLGGTGYINPGSGGRVKFRDRVATDVIAYSPDVVVVEGGINDYSNSKATIKTEATALYQQIRAGLPAALIVVLSPMWRNGVESFPAGLLDCRDALREAAALVSNTVFVDVLEMPLDAGTAPSTTLNSSASAAATSISLVGCMPVRSTVEIGTGTANVERRVITGLSGGGPFTATVAALTNSHSAAETVTMVGPTLWTGLGKVTATTGAGNSDLLVSSDGTHPSQDGHDEIGTLVARLLAPRLPV
jgi:lysophospholipase L1-like esterase